MVLLDATGTILIDSIPLMFSFEDEDDDTLDDWEAMMEAQKTMHVCINTNITNVSIGPEFGNMRYMHSTPHMTFFTTFPNLAPLQQKRARCTRALRARPVSLRV